MKKVIKAVVTVLLFIPRQIRRLWRWVTPEGSKKVAYLSLSLFLLLAVYNTQQQRQASKVNRTILYTIQDQTSPEAVARQEATIDDIIDVVDCKNQAALQRVIDVLVFNEVLNSGEVKAITEHCQAVTGNN